MIVVAAPIAFVCLLLFLLALSSYSQSVSAKNWSSASGKILESYIKEKVKEDRIKYKPRVRYEFSYLGKVYQGRSLTSGARYGTRDKAHAEQLLEPYSVGAEVQVYFNPKKPSRNALAVNSQEPSLNFLAVCTAMMVCSLLFLILSLL